MKREYFRWFQLSSGRCCFVIASELNNSRWWLYKYTKSAGTTQVCLERTCIRAHIGFVGVFETVVHISSHILAQQWNQNVTAKWTSRFARAVCVCVRVLLPHVIIVTALFFVHLFSLLLLMWFLLRLTSLLFSVIVADSENWFSHTWCVCARALALTLRVCIYCNLVHADCLTRG